MVEDMTDETAADKVVSAASDAAHLVTEDAAKAADLVRSDAVHVADHLITHAAGVADHVVTEAADVAGMVVSEATAARLLVTEAATKLTKNIELLTTSVLASNRVSEVLGDQIGSSNKRITALGTYGRHTRALIWALAASLFVDVCLTIGLGVAWARLDQTSAATASLAITTSSLAVANQAALVASCTNGNSVRLNDIVLWTHVLNIVAPADRTAAQAKSTADLLNFVDETFAPRKCS